MNKTKLVFETTAELKAFIKRRKITHGSINATEITLTAVLGGKDIELAIRDYHARVVPQ